MFNARRIVALRRWLIWRLNGSHKRFFNAENAGVAEDINMESLAVLRVLCGLCV